MYSSYSVDVQNRNHQSLSVTTLHANPISHEQRIQDALTPIPSFSPSSSSPLISSTPNTSLLNFYLLYERFLKPSTAGATPSHNSSLRIFPDRPRQGSNGERERERELSFRQKDGPDLVYLFVTIPGYTEDLCLPFFSLLPSVITKQHHTSERYFRKPNYNIKNTAAARTSSTWRSATLLPVFAAPSGVGGSITDRPVTEAE